MLQKGRGHRSQSVIAVGVAASLAKGGKSPGARRQSVATERPAAAGPDDGPGPQEEGKSPGGLNAAKVLQAKEFEIFEFKEEIKQLKRDMLQASTRPAPAPPTHAPPRFSPHPLCC
jgi:hypothetical protein